MGPLDGFAATDPLLRIHSEFNTYGKAMQGTGKPIVLIGMWLLWGPPFVGFIGLAIFFVVEFFADVNWYYRSSTAGDILALIFAVAFCGVLVLISGKILYKTTAGFKRARIAAANESQEETDGEHPNEENVEMDERPSRRLVVEHLRQVDDSLQHITPVAALCFGAACVERQSRFYRQEQAKSQNGAASYRKSLDEIWNDLISGHTPRNGLSEEIQRVLIDSDRSLLRHSPAFYAAESLVTLATAVEGVLTHSIVDLARISAQLNFNDPEIEASDQQEQDATVVGVEAEEASDTEAAQPDDVPNPAVELELQYQREDLADLLNNAGPKTITTIRDRASRAYA